MIPFHHRHKTKNEWIIGFARFESYTEHVAPLIETKVILFLQFTETPKRLKN